MGGTERRKSVPGSERQGRFTRNRSCVRSQGRRIGQQTPMVDSLKQTLGDERERTRESRARSQKKIFKCKKRERERESRGLIGHCQITVLVAANNAMER